jgi:hypothetical protein
MYNKLFTKILDSSIWLQSSPTRIVWLTFIATMDETGFVQFAGVGNVAHRALVSVEEAQTAIDYLEGKDPESADPEHDGRRVERVPGGWIVLNACKYRAIVTKAVSREQTRERVRRHRNGGVTLCNARVTPSEAEAEAEDTDTARRQKPLGYRPCVDVAWAGRPPVPGSLHAEFRNKLGGNAETADERLFAWYPQAAAPYEGQPIGDDDYAFWRARFREWVGTTRTTQPANRAPSADAWARADAWCQHEPRCASRGAHQTVLDREQTNARTT